MYKWHNHILPPYAEFIINIIGPKLLKWRQQKVLFICYHQLGIKVINKSCGLWGSKMSKLSPTKKNQMTLGQRRLQWVLTNLMTICLFLHHSHQFWHLFNPKDQDHSILATPDYSFYLKYPYWIINWDIGMNIPTFYFRLKSWNISFF